MNPHIKYLVDTHSVISFDIFDTLLIRPYINPYHVIKHLEQFTCPGFECIRLRAEQSARSSSVHEDVTLDEIYGYIPAQFQKYRETELELEKTILSKRPDVFEIYRYACETNKKIAIISDIYLPKSFLTEVLAKNGYKHIDMFYVSCEIGKTKHTGNLFKEFLKRENIKASEILHIGDSAVSDIQKATKNGICAYQVERVSSAFLQKPENKHYLHLYENYSDSLEISMILALLAEKEKFNFAGTDKDSYWKHFGYLIGGPIAYGLSNFVLKTSAKENLQELLFVARDGYSLKRVSDILSDSKDIRTHYVYAQRILRAKCLGDWDDEYNADLVLNVLKENNINIPKLTTYQDKQDFLRRHAADLNKINRENKQEYHRYLNSLGIDFSKPSAVIDSGAATFSAQRLISNTVSTDLTGLYSIVTRPVYAVEKGISYRVWAAHENDINAINSIIEFVLQAPEAPVHGIHNCKPEHSTPAPEESVRIETAKLLSGGICQFAQDMRNRFQHFLPDFQPEPINLLVQNKLENLNKTDKKMLGTIRCPSNGAHTRYGKNLLTDKIMIRPKNIFLFGIKLLWVYNQQVQTKAYLFKHILLYTQIKRFVCTYGFLFGIVPIIKVKHRPQKTTYYLFGALPILKIKN